MLKKKLKFLFSKSFSKSNSNSDVTSSCTVTVVFHIMEASTLLPAAQHLTAHCSLLQNLQCQKMQKLFSKMKLLSSSVTQCECVLCDCFTIKPPRVSPCDAFNVEQQQCRAPATLAALPHRFHCYKKGEERVNSEADINVMKFVCCIVSR